MRLSAHLDVHAAIAMLVDPGSEKFHFVSRDFVKKHGIVMFTAKNPTKET